MLIRNDIVETLINELFGYDTNSIEMLNKLCSVLADECHIKVKDTIVENGFYDKDINTAVTKKVQKTLHNYLIDMGKDRIHGIIDGTEEDAEKIYNFIFNLSAFEFDKLFNNIVDWDETLYCNVCYLIAEVEKRLNVSLAS